MDLPRLTLLKQIDLRLSQEGPKTLFLARDRANGKIFTISRTLVRHLREARSLLSGQTLPQEASFQKMDNDAARDLFRFLHIVGNMRDRETLHRTRFNPVFMSIPLIDFGRHQKRLQPLAQALVRPAYFALMALLLIWCITLGIRNDWSIMDVFSSIFSLEAIITFGLIAPFLKVIHELGHLLTATRFGVRVRKAGIYLISFYPLPYVDCSDADFSARRRHRILISLAGIVVDVTIGMIAFIGWHFTRGSYMQTIFGNIFVFSTLNSIFFNANPLSKLDGYFAFSDAIGQRNLYTNSSMRLSDALRFILSLGQQGALPKNSKQILAVAYSMGTIWYRIYIVYHIALGMAPKYLGVGIICVLWGLFVMFWTPIKTFVERSLDHTAAANTQAKKGAGRMKPRLVGLGILLALIVFIGFVPFPFSTVIPVRLDAEQAYSITTGHKGFVQKIHASGAVQKGDILVEMDDPQINDELVLVKHQLAEAALALQSARGAGAAQAQAMQKQYASLQDRRRILRKAQAEQIIRADEDGYFISTTHSNDNALKAAGQTMGELLPSHGVATFSGQFPERYVAKFQTDFVGADFRLNQAYYPLPPETFRLQAIMIYQQEAGTRSYRVRFTFDRPPAQLAGKPGQVKFTFRAEPLWRHLKFWYENLLANFRQSQLTDREKYLSE